MATTNLISKTLGCVLTESGNGTPDHTSPLGSIYSDKDTGRVYTNIDGGTLWEQLSVVAYGEAYVQENTSPTTISDDNWTASGINMTEGIVIGFSGGTTNLTLLDGYDGDYEVKLDATLTYVAGSVNFEAGVSVNGADPADGTFGGCFLNSTQLTQHVGSQSIISLTGGTTLSIDVRNATVADSNNVILEHAQLFARKVG